MEILRKIPRPKNLGFHIVLRLSFGPLYMTELSHIHKNKSYAPKFAYTPTFRYKGWHYMIIFFQKKKLFYNFNPLHSSLCVYWYRCIHNLGEDLSQVMTFYSSTELRIERLWVPWVMDYKTKQVPNCWKYPASVCLNLYFIFLINFTHTEGNSSWHQKWSHLTFYCYLLVSFFYFDKKIIRNNQLF